MSADTESLHGDLAYMRALLEGGDNAYGKLGEGYFLAGLIYGAQILMHAAQYFAWLPSAQPWGMAIGFGPTVVFILAIVWINRRRPDERRSSTTGRAVNTMFGTAGAANVVLMCVIGAVALRERSFPTWLIYPSAVFVLQGAVWLFAWALRRRAWMGMVAVGWFLAAIVMALTVESLGWYLLAAGLGIWLLMALPGWVMVRLSRVAA